MNNTDELLLEVHSELTKLVNVAVTMLNTYQKIQVDRFPNDEIMKQGHHERSFYMRYHNTVEIASRVAQTNIKELDLINAKKEVQRRDNEIKKVNDIIKEKME